MRFLNVKEIILLAAASAILALCALYQDKVVYHDKWWRGSGAYVQKVRLPKPEVVKVAALGYDNLYADYLTLKAIQQFGAGWRTTDGSTEPIYEFFDLITELDPHFTGAYEFGNMILSDDRGDHEAGMRLVEKGIKNNPDHWKLAYLGIYTSIWGAEDPERALEFLEYAKRAEDTPGYVLRMGEFAKRLMGNYPAAFEFLMEQMIDYLEKGQTFEAEVALLRFQGSLDSWYKQELRKAAERYHDAFDAHPAQIEELFDPEIMPPYQAPTMENIREIFELARKSPADARDRMGALVQAAYEPIVGLPPDPFGTWYYIDTEMRDEFISNYALDISSTAPLQQRFPYFAAAREELEDVNQRSMDAQRFILDFKQKNDDFPSAEDMAAYTTADPMGGHYVYNPELSDEGFPTFFSTTTMRVNEGREPRMGLRGLEMPERPVSIEGMPDYLQPEPSIWDYPVDIEWARGRGLLEGVRIPRQPAYITGGGGATAEAPLPSS
ncbi:MAG: hypothetical protein RLY93_15585 [Sumerlaeia bacterium]